MCFENFRYNKQKLQFERQILQENGCGGAFKGVTKQLHAELVPQTVYELDPSSTSCTSAPSEPCTGSLLMAILSLLGPDSLITYGD